MEVGREGEKKRSRSLALVSSVQAGMAGLASKGVLRGEHGGRMGKDWLQATV